MSAPDLPVPGFLVSRVTRDRFGLDDGFLAEDGRVLVAGFARARRVAERMSMPGRAPVAAADVWAVALLDAALRRLVAHHELHHPGAIERAFARAAARFGGEAVQDALFWFVARFPRAAAGDSPVSIRAWLADGDAGGSANRLKAFADLLLLRVANLNPALARYRPWFDDRPLQAEAGDLLDDLPRCFAAAHPGAGSSLFDELRAAAAAAPDSLAAQLAFLLGQPAAACGGDRIRPLSADADSGEEEAAPDAGSGHSGGFAPLASSDPAETAGSAEEAGPAEEAGFAEEAGPARFSDDRAWMNRLVLLAKHAHVWLGQLSRQHGREIRRLDEIPEEELASLAARGFTGLWLIGIWERSRASAAIKRLAGDELAEASAYSLFSHDIAADLGGWAALRRLRRRARRHGLRLAADMVPNHTGIDSRWVNEHPEWFLAAPAPPFPGYTFQGPDLGSDPRVGIYLEDHYYDRSDASVVFCRVDKTSGEARYLYHGNDGTGMPWNDTAQLNHLLPEVREALIRSILRLARQFPVIRFDSAMTLARQHIRRLWFPAPGTGATIPSRAAHALARAEFDRLMPGEFWREVVERVAAEAPGTMLLAEAFWLLEGYFVRGLGLHRVYNSAFMHMLRDEDNAGFRALLRKTLECDPRMLARHVNFMNNPDERTAADQFGKGDKYFGTCVLMCCLPGLPMFGHGQVEGFTEKYGMEFLRARLDERPDEDFVRRHEEIVFPLLRRRGLFAGVGHFRLLDALDPAGRINEDVLAFANRRGRERVLAIYQNKGTRARCTLGMPAGWSGGGTGGRGLAGALGLPAGALDFVVFRDAVGGGERIRSCRELAERGLTIDLGPHQAMVLLDWQVVRGDDWRAIRETLGDGAVASVQQARDRLRRGRGKKGARGRTPP